MILKIISKFLGVNFFLTHTVLYVPSFSVKGYCMLLHWAIIREDRWLWGKCQLRRKREEN